MPAMTMTNKVYQPLEQAAHMTGAAKNIILEDTFSRYLVELQEDAARADTLRQRGLGISQAAQPNCKRTANRLYL